jgi:misacylated tRNA(Ala) deacylase
MNKLLYQTDSYLSVFTSRVQFVDVGARALSLDQTAFYPGGGGQLADKGWIEADGLNYPVVRARKSGEMVLHIIDGNNPLPKSGTRVEGRLDWDHRYKLMRTHTAMHILCGVIFRDYGSSVTGGDMEPLKGRMDFEFETMHKDLVHSIESAINQEVLNSRNVRIEILPRDVAFNIPDLIRTKINLLPVGIQEVRVVEIEGLDLQADGGTHVNNTSEVGGIRVVDYKSKGKINKRIYVELDPES